MSERRRPSWPPSRGMAIRAVLAIAVVLSATVAITTGVLAGITLLVGFSGVLSLTLLLVPARPRLAASLRGGENATRSPVGSDLLVGFDRKVRHFDIDRIVESEEEAARGTMPRAPTPRYPPGALGLFESAAALSTAFGAAGGATDDELQEFLDKVEAYGEELRAWLEVLVESRDETLRHFTLAARVEEMGQAPADFTRVRLTFPAGFEEPARPPWVPEPPRRPEFVGRFGGIAFPRVEPVRVSPGALRDLIASPEAIRGDAADYSSEDGTTVVDLNVGHVNQREYRDTATFSLRAAPVGVHQVRWRIGASGLGSPAEGTILVEVVAPTAGEPILGIAEAMTERDSHNLD